MINLICITAPPKRSKSVRKDNHCTYKVLISNHEEQYKIETFPP